MANSSPSLTARSALCDGDRPVAEHLPDADQLDLWIVNGSSDIHSQL